MPIQLESALIEAGVSVVGILVTVFIGFGINYLKVKSKDIENKTIREALWNSLEEAETIADKSIETVEQTFVKDLKAAAEDGKLTSEEKRDALTKAKQTFINTLSNESISVIKGQTDNFDKWVADYLEAKLYEKTSIQKELDRISDPK
jgi:translation elongation factor EF-1beta